MVRTRVSPRKKGLSILRVFLFIWKCTTFIYWKSLKSKLHYTGIAKDVEARLRDHNRGKSKFTKGHLPWKLVYVEGPFETSVARRREKELKRTEEKERVLKGND